MILVGKGKLSVAQSVAATSAISTNVIQLGTYAAAGWAVDGLEDAILSIMNAAVPSGSTGALTIDLVLALEAALTNRTVIDRCYIAGITDYRVAVAGAPIHEFKIPSWISWLAKKIGDANTSDMFMGLYITAATATYTISAAISSAKQTDAAVKTQVVTSPVGVPGYASAGS